MKKLSLVEKIKLILSIRKPATELADELKTVKSGWHTAGWWATVLATLLTLAGAVAHILPATTAVVIVVTLTALYNLARMFVNSGSAGVQPLLMSTRFWGGVLGIISTALISLQAGGVNPEWVKAGIGLIAAIMAAAQIKGADQPPEAPKE